MENMILSIEFDRLFSLIEQPFNQDENVLIFQDVCFSDVPSNPGMWLLLTCNHMIHACWYTQKRVDPCKSHCRCIRLYPDMNARSKKAPCRRCNRIRSCQSWEQNWDKIKESLIVSNLKLGKASFVGARPFLFWAVEIRWRFSWRQFFSRAHL